MKKTFVLLGILMLTLMQVLADAPKPYKLKVLTFEDADAKSGFRALAEDQYRRQNVYFAYDEYYSDSDYDEYYYDDYGEDPEPYSNPWTSLIDNPQMYGSLLYTNSGNPIYWWYDGGNTGLRSPTVLSDFWNSGHAISHYGSADYMTYGDYTSQLTVYQAGNDALRTSGCGHNGSNNFCIHFGYIDGWGASTIGDLPRLTFEDGVARVIDHMYVAPTTYTYRAYVAGDAMGLVTPPNPSDKLWLVAYGYKTLQEIEDGEPSVSTTFDMADGAGNVVSDWTKWDLSILGEVLAVSFNLDGDDFAKNNGYLVYPGYFAYDDVAVQYPRWCYTRDNLTIGNYGTICLPRDIAAGDYEGATFYKVVERNSAGIVLEEVTSLTAGQAYIFQATATTLRAYSDDEEDCVSEPAPATTSNVLQGVFTNTTPSAGWILKDNELHPCAGYNHTVPANRAYLTELIPDFTQPVPGRRRVQMAIRQTPTDLQDVEAQDAQTQKTMQNGVLYINKNGNIYNVQGQIVK